MSEQHLITPVSFRGPVASPLAVETPTMEAAIKAISDNDSYLGFQFQNSATRYIVAEKVYTQDEVKQNRDLYTGLQAHFNIRPESVVVYDTGRAMRYLDAEDRDNTVLVNRQGKQLFPAR